MVGKGLSPKLNRLVVTASSSKKKASPKCGGAKKASPKAQQRVYWNPVLEKSLVDILHNHKDNRGDTGSFKTEKWNSIVAEFHTKNQYARYSRHKIQEKERELKRDYKMLKEALQQSGCSWNHERCMIEAEPHLWDNLIISFPKIKKFRNAKARFPLFDALGELYDGHLAEGNYNITSRGFPEDEEPLKQFLLDTEDDSVAEQVHVDDQNGHHMEEDDVEVIETRSDVEVVEPRSDVEVVATAAQTGHQRRRISAATKQDKKEEKEAKKAKKSSNVEGMMERYLELRTKQVEQEAVLLERENQPIQATTDFSITRCIAVLNKMEVTCVEKVKAYSAFKSAENREIFLSSYEVDEESALMWLRSEIAP